MGRKRRDTSREILIGPADPDLIPLLAIRHGPLPRRPFGAYAAIKDGKPIGAMFYRIEKHGLRLLHISTSKGHRRKNVATLLLQQLDDDEPVFAAVPEPDLPTQCLLRRNGYRCHRIEAGDPPLYHFTRHSRTQ